MRHTLPFFALLTATTAFATVTTYTDQAQFLAAASALPLTQQLHEQFNGPLQAPLSIKDYSYWPRFDSMGHQLPFDDPTYGYLVDSHSIGGGQLTGCVGYNCGVGLVNVTSVWLFAKPLLAFGATFKYLNHEPQSGGIESLAFQDGFFGFISDIPLTKFAFVVADNPFGNCGSPCHPPTQQYSMQNLYAQVQSGSAAVPEPKNWALLLSGFSILCCCLPFLPRAH